MLLGFVLATLGGPSALGAATRAEAPPAAAEATVLWKFQVNGSYVLHPPAVGPDGGIVVATSIGDVYLLTAAGTLRWMVPGVGDYGPPTIGPDGTVYVASGRKITAISPAGAIKWTFTDPAISQGVMAGPTVGPDGNIYGVMDQGSLGAFALSPAGTLLWSNQGNPVFADRGQLGAEVVFTPGRLHVAFDEFGQVQSTIFGLSLGGSQQWAEELGGADDPLMQQQRQPASGADGSLYMTGAGGANGWSLYRVDPNNGNVLWSYSPFPSNGMSAPSVGPDGSVYFARSLVFLESVSSSGSSRWVFDDGSIISKPGVSPDGSVVVAGVRPNFGLPGSARAWDAATGAVLWDVPLGGAAEGNPIVFSPPRFSADSQTVYFGTSTTLGTSSVYAVSVGDTPPPPPPPPPGGCVVPNVVGMKQNPAKKAIIAAQCAVGTITKVSSRPAGVVLSQSPVAGVSLPKGSPVNITVSKR